MSKADTAESGEGFSQVGTTNVGSALVNLLAAEAIVPGSPPSYQICKEIFVSHPLGAKMTEMPVKKAMAKPRKVAVAVGAAEDRLKDAFASEWKALRADFVIASTMTTARIYGVGTLVTGARGVDPRTPLDPKELHSQDVYFNVLDPLNTAGSLVLDQDPNSPDFQKPRAVAVAGVAYHPSRAVVMMNEQPVYIEYSDSAFGFVGRSVFQRALFPMKTFLQSMITDNYVTLKVGLLVAKMKAPGSVMNNRILGFFGIKRSQLKAGVTGNVLTIGTEDDISSLNFQNLEGPAKMARDNCLKDIAMAAGMPAKLLEQEEMVSGMAEGSEDAASIAEYLGGVRTEMAPLYDHMDMVAQRRAWSPAFYETVKAEFPEEYGRVPYETAFYRWRNKFKAEWPNLLDEPDSEKSKMEDVRLKSAIAVAEVVLPAVDQANKAKVIEWLQENVNTNRLLFTASLDLDIEAIAEMEPPPQPGAGAPQEGETEEPAPPLPFKSAA